MVKAGLGADVADSGNMALEGATEVGADVTRGGDGALEGWEVTRSSVGDAEAEDSIGIAVGDVNGELDGLLVGLRDGCCAPKE